MRKLLGSLLLFGLGVVVGTAGTDDSLLREAEQQQQQAYDRGFVDATTRFQAIAVQTGHAAWEQDLGGRQRHRFVWRPVSFESELPPAEVLAIVPDAGAP